MYVKVGLVVVQIVIAKPGLLAQVIPVEKLTQEEDAMEHPIVV